MSRAFAPPPGATILWPPAPPLAILPPRIVPVNPWTISPASPADLTDLTSLAAQTFPLACPPESTAAEIADHIASHLSADRFQAWLTDPASFIQVARTEAGLAGYVLVCLDPEEETPQVGARLTLRPSCELSKCYVLPAHQGRGLAAALMASALDQAASRGRRGAWLGVNGKNARAIAFYQKVGFRIIGPRNYEVGGRVHDDYLMEIDLNQRPAAFPQP